MKWDIFFTIKGPGGVVTAPNSTNPVESANLASLLRKLMDNLPGSAMGVDIECIGLRISPAKEDSDSVCEMTE
jgi:hypothetical protein